MSDMLVYIYMIELSEIRKVGNTFLFNLVYVDHNNI